VGGTILRAGHQAYALTSVTSQPVSTLRFRKARAPFAPRMVLRLGLQARRFASSSGEPPVNAPCPANVGDYEDHMSVFPPSRTPVVVANKKHAFVVSPGHGICRP